MIQKQWEDCDLTRISLDETLSQLTIELSSTYDGKTLVILVCKGLISLHLNSGLAFDESGLPVFVGKVQLHKIAGEDVLPSLQSHGYSFSAVGNRINSTQDCIWRIVIEGGQIESDVLVTDCKIT